MKRYALVFLLLAAGCSAPDTAERSDDPYTAARTALRQGRLEKAQGIADAAIEKNSAQAPLRLRLLQIEILMARGRVRTASRLLEEIPEPQDQQLRLRWMGDRAEALHKTEHTDAALPLLNEVDRIVGKEPSEVGFKASLLRSAILTGRGAILEAEATLQDVAARASKAGDIYHQAAALLNFSFVKLRQQRYDDSLAYSLSAVKAAEMAGDLRLAGLANDNLGIGYTVLGDLNRAQDHIETSVRQLREVDDLRNLSDALGELGNVHLRRGDPAAAQPFFEQAVDAASKVEFQPGAALWSGQLAMALIEQEKWTEAEEANRRAAEAGGGQNLYLKLNEAAIAGQSGNIDEAIAMYRTILSASSQDPYVTWMAHVNLASLLATRDQLDAAGRECLAGLNVVEQIRAGLHERDSKIRYHDLKMRFFQDCVDLLVRQGKSETALKVVEFSRGRVLTEGLGAQMASIDDVHIDAMERQAARTSSVLLSYWVAPKRSFVWVITGSKVTRHELPPKDMIEAAVRGYRKAIEQDMRDPLAVHVPQGEQLREILLDPIEEQLKGVERVAIVADGPLHALNFETLPVANGDHYWIEEVEVTVTPSLALLAQPAPKRGEKPASLLLLGAPVSEDPEFPELPAAQLEVRGIRSQFLSGRYQGMRQVVRTGAEATPAAFLTSEPDGFSLIHFAAHAEANPQSPLDSAVILSRDQTGDRFKLYARDIATLSLGANLVTISACRSAGAQSFGGEGLVGFAWAFLHAGARSVIAGLWDVGDDSSAELMTRLYEGLARDMPPAAALRQAKLSLIRSNDSHRNPFYWAPYQTYAR